MSGAAGLLSGEAAASAPSQAGNFAQTMSNSKARSACLRRVEARDRRMAAIHEAGHVVMARGVGLDVLGASLEKTPDPGVYDTMDWTHPVLP